MLVDLKLQGRRVLVVGPRPSARARRALLEREGAEVVSVRPPAPRNSGKGGRRSVDEAAGLAQLVRRTRPDVIFSLLEGDRQNRRLASAARASGALLHVYDAPALCDFTLPSASDTGGIRLAVSTSGQSPAMAALLRRRLERSIRPADVALVRLQGRLRGEIRRTFPTYEARKEAIYRLIRGREVRRLLGAGRFREAVVLARRQIASWARAASPVPARRAR